MYVCYYFTKKLLDGFGLNLAQRYNRLYCTPKFEHSSFKEIVNLWLEDRFIDYNIE